MTVKAKVAMPPARALKDVANTLAKRGSTTPSRDDSVTVEALDSDLTHLELARERYRDTQPGKTRRYRST